LDVCFSFHNDLQTPGYWQALPSPFTPHRHKKGVKKSNQFGAD